MDRREFVQICALLGIGVGELAGCAESSPGDALAPPDVEASRDPSVIIVGAGVAGLSAGMELARNGIDFRILEASGRYGGRARAHHDFVDYPVDLGAEWIHRVSPREGPVILDELARVPASSLAEQWKPMTGATWDGTSLHRADLLMRLWREDWRFKTTTWFDFFDRFVVPRVRDRIELGVAVTGIDWSGDRIRVDMTGQRAVETEHVIVTVPVRILMDGDIRFTPPLPASKRAAFEHVAMPGGLKLFIEFRECFYPHVVSLPGATDGREGEAIFYDESLDKDSKRHVLGLVCTGQPAEQFTRHETEAELMGHVLGLLDRMFEGAATRHYVRHVVQDWSREPFIRGTYSDFFGNESAVAALAADIDERIYFAGEAYGGLEWGYLHTAARSGRERAERIVARIEARG